MGQTCGAFSKYLNFSKKSRNKIHHKFHFFIFQIPPEQPAPAIATIAQTLISKRTMGRGVSANPNLSLVQEEEDMSEANESLIQKDHVDAPVRRFLLDTISLYELGMKPNYSRDK